MTAGPDAGLTLATGLEMKVRRDTCREGLDTGEHVGAELGRLGIKHAQRAEQLAVSEIERHRDVTLEPVNLRSMVPGVHRILAGFAEARGLTGSQLAANRGLEDQVLSGTQPEIEKVVHRARRPPVLGHACDGREAHARDRAHLGEDLLQVGNLGYRGDLRDTNVVRLDLVINFLMQRLESVERGGLDQSLDGRRGYAESPRWPHEVDVLSDQAHVGESMLGNESLGVPQERLLPRQVWDSIEERDEYRFVGRLRRRAGHVESDEVRRISHEVCSECRDGGEARQCLTFHRDTAIEP